MSKIKQDVVNELHKPARKNFPRRRVIVKGIDDLWQIDLAEFRPYARENRGFKYILIVIDCFSKYLWTQPLKTKNAEEVSKAMGKILQEGRTPTNLQSDSGKEFFNSHFKKLLDKYNINHYSSYSTKKASIAERVIRTVKEHLYKEFSLRGKYKWIDILHTTTDKYNQRKHRSIGMRPADVTRKHEQLLLSTVYSNIKIKQKQLFNVGDIVRISKFKNIFEKGYTPNWSTELFKIVKVQITNPTTSLLEDMNGRPIFGGFYEQELQLVKHPDVYLVEKVLREKGKQVFVKWLGLDKSQNSWIRQNDIV